MSHYDLSAARSDDAPDGLRGGAWPVNDAGEAVGVPAEPSAEMPLTTSWDDEAALINAAEATRAAQEPRP